MRSATHTCAAAILAAAATLAPAVSQAQTTYPISHVVVIFQENGSLDHFFATYPVARNTVGEPPCQAKANTPTVNGLNQNLLSSNPNKLQPQRLDRSHVNTADQDHNYMAEQQAFDKGLMDKFVQFTGVPEGSGPSKVMDYFDGNTVTALWNYAHPYALSDNSFATHSAPPPFAAFTPISR